MVGTSPRLRPSDRILRKAASGCRECRGSPRSFVALLAVWKGPRGHIPVVGLEGVADQSRSVHPGANELGPEGGGDTEQVLKHQNLTVDVATRRRCRSWGSPTCAVTSAATVGRHRFEHQGEAARVLECGGLLDQQGGGFFAPPLDLESRRAGGPIAGSARGGP